MKPEYINNGVRANCVDCGGAVTSFESFYNGNQFQSIHNSKDYKLEEQNFKSCNYQLVRCAGCGRGGLAELYHNNDNKYILGKLFPATVDVAALPQNAPDEIVKEFREAEICLSVFAYRAASAMFRSTLEKTLKINGYLTGNLENKINEAATEGVISIARSKRVHEDVRVLGNEVVHDKWREVKADEVELSHHYVQRIIEDLYDDRVSVEKILTSKKRITQNIKSTP
jgi:hypothetical protein